MMLRLALRELKMTGRKLLVVFFILIIGLIGPLLSSGLKTSVAQYLTSRSREILSADLAVNGMRPLSGEESAALEKITSHKRISRTVEFMTMGKGREASTLVEVKAVDSVFPIYGEFTFEDAVARSTKDLTQDRIAWVFPEVLAQLGLKVGDEIGLGDTGFKIAAVVKDSPGVSRAGAAPAVFVGSDFAKATGLTEFGSQVFYRNFLQLVGITSEEASRRVKEAIADPDIFLRTPDDSTNGLERFFGFFNLYLVSISMVVFALSWVSAFYILQMFLQDRSRNAAVLMTFGASRLRTYLISLAQIATILFASFAVAAIFVEGLLLVAAHLAPEDLLPKGFVLKLGVPDLISVGIVALISCVGFSLPIAIRLFRMKLQDLLNDDTMGAGRMSSQLAVLAYAPLVVAFFGLSIWLMDSFRNAIYLTGGIIAAIFLGWSLARVSFKALFQASKHQPGFARLIFTNLSRSRFGVNLCFITLLLGTLVLNLVPHLLRSAMNEVEPLQGKEVPALFLFNIPESSLLGLQEMVQEQGAELRFISPFILGRFMTVNGKDTGLDRFQRFPVRVSYRPEQIPSETIVAGKWFSGRHDPASNQPAEISVEANFADRNSLKLGDVLGFDVQGVPIEGRITSLRKVKWTSFNPNFFMMFQPGVLDDAPKTYIANVNIPGLDDEKNRAKVELQYGIVKNFPDLNVIDIGRTVERTLEIARSVFKPIRAMAWIAVLMSFLILVGVIVHNVRMRNPEIDIQKMLGADRTLIRNLIVGEYLTLAGLATLFGGVFAVALTWIVTERIFEIEMKVDWMPLAFSMFVTIGLT
ncbi:MAG TPA: FtsX-like permease family protein, partial [Bdellovibrionales bacterium]|nr:FtsX-like permease family protein [Bdellovibrionales bacterium]